MIWGGISYYGKTRLVVIRVNLNNQRYMDEVLTPCCSSISGEYGKRCRLPGRQCRATPCQIFTCVITLHIWISQPTPQIYHTWTSVGWAREEASSASSSRQHFKQIWSVSCCRSGMLSLRGKCNASFTAWGTGVRHAQLHVGMWQDTEHVYILLNKQGYCLSMCVYLLRDNLPICSVRTYVSICKFWCMTPPPPPIHMRHITLVSFA